MTDVSLNAPSQARTHAKGDDPVCLECGERLAGLTAAYFCSAVCKTRWNNRRLQRGAILFDLFMVHRYERPLAKAEGVFTMINRLGITFREEDKFQRNGRRSWRRFRDVIADRPNLRAVVVWRGKRKAAL